MSDRTVKIALPIGAVTIGAHPLSPRLESLRGARLGMIDNSKAGSDVLLRTIGEELTSRYGVAEVVYVRKPGSTMPIGEASLRPLLRCGAVISGVGD